MDKKPIYENLRNSPAKDEDTEESFLDFALKQELDDDLRSNANFFRHYFQGARRYFYKEFARMFTEGSKTRWDTTSASPQFKFDFDLVASFLQELPHPDTPPTRWRLGFDLYTQSVGHFVDNYKMRSSGTKPQDATRVFILFYVEWQIVGLKLDKMQATDLAAEYFDQPPSLILKWVNDSKGKYIVEKKISTQMLNWALRSQNRLINH